jgi:hypothetical protein
MRDREAKGAAAAAGAGRIMQGVRGWGAGGSAGEAWFMHSTKAEEGEIAAMNRTERVQVMDTSVAAAGAGTSTLHEPTTLNTLSTLADDDDDAADDGATMQHPILKEPHHANEKKRRYTYPITPPPPLTGRQA